MNAALPRGKTARSKRRIIYMISAFASFWFGPGFPEKRVPNFPAVLILRSLFFNLLFSPGPLPFPSA